MWKSTWICLQYLHTLTKSSYIGVCIPVGNWFWSSLSKKILYSGSLLIITGIRASCVLLRKELNVAGLSMDIQKTEWIEHMDSGRQRVNDSVPGWEMIL